MKKRYLFTLAGFVLGAACALVQNVSGADIMVTLLRPFTLLGNVLRSWSLSGAKGNALAWAVLIVLSLLPVVYMLIARRKRKQTGDWLFLLTGAVVFGGLFLLINPTLYVHPVMTEALDYSPELLTGGPTFAIISMLLLSAVARWSGGLMRLKKQDGRLIFWTQALLIGSMALIAFSLGFGIAEGAQSLLSGAESSSDPWANFEDFYAPSIQSSLSVSSGIQDASALIGFILIIVLLIPDLFSVWTLDAAVSLASSMERGFFSEETDACAANLAVRARYTLIAAVGCMAVKNILTTALAQWILSWNMSFSLPIEDLLISCGAMMLARLLSAACKVKRDNDLMI